MFRNSYQSGFLSIFYSVGSSPLNIWDKSVKNGHIRRVSDEDVKSLVLELSGTNVATTYITCPIKPKASLGIKLPYLVMIVKNMKKYFTFEIQIRDDKDMHRRFRVSNFQSTTKVRPFCTSMPIGLSSGWNQIQFNLADFTRRAYGTTYIETTRVQIHANVRIRRIYFADRLYSEDEMPQEFKLFLPAEKTQARDKAAAGTPGKKKSQESVPKVSKVSASALPISAGVIPAEVEAMPAEEAEIPSGAPPTPIATDISEEPMSAREEAVETDAAVEAEGATEGVETAAAAEATPEQTVAVEGAQEVEEGVVQEAIPAETEVASAVDEAAPAEEANAIPAEVPAATEEVAAAEAPPEEQATEEAPTEPAAEN